MKNKNLNLTRKNVKAVFGEPNQEKNGEMIYGCQLCKEEGHDTDKSMLIKDVLRALRMKNTQKFTEKCIQIM